MTFRKLFGDDLEPKWSRYIIFRLSIRVYHRISCLIPEREFDTLSRDLADLYVSELKKGFRSITYFWCMWKPIPVVYMSSDSIMGDSNLSCWPLLYHMVEHDCKNPFKLTNSITNTLRRKKQRERNEAKDTSSIIHWKQSRYKYNECGSKYIHIQLKRSKTREHERDENGYNCYTRAITNPHTCNNRITDSQL